MGGNIFCCKVQFFIWLSGYLAIFVRVACQHFSALSPPHFFPLLFFWLFALIVIGQNSQWRGDGVQLFMLLWRCHSGGDEALSGADIFLFSFLQSLFPSLSFFPPLYLSFSIPHSLSFPVKLCLSQHCQVNSVKFIFLCVLRCCTLSPMLCSTLCFFSLQWEENKLIFNWVTGLNPWLK